MQMKVVAWGETERRANLCWNHEAALLTEYKRGIHD
jgi:hypothetical protein